MEKKTPANTTLTRVAFCQNCFDNKMPQKGNLFLTIGRGKQQYGVREATLNGRMGFTPHIIERKSSGQGHVTFYSYCGMDGCGCKLDFNETSGKYDITVLNEVTKVLPIKDYNAMVQYTRDSDYYLD